MPEFNKTDTGTLGDNRYKDSPKHPDLTGKLEGCSTEVIAAIARGERVRLAGWWREGRDGERFLSLKVSVIRAKADAPSSHDWKADEQRELKRQAELPVERSVTADFDDAIPF